MTSPIQRSFMPSSDAMEYLPLEDNKKIKDKKTIATEDQIPLPEISKNVHQYGFTGYD